MFSVIQMLDIFKQPPQRYPVPYWWAGNVGRHAPPPLLPFYSFIFFCVVVKLDPTNCCCNYYYYYYQKMDSSSLCWTIAPYTSIPLYILGINNLGCILYCKNHEFSPSSKMPWVSSPFFISHSPNLLDISKFGLNCYLFIIKPKDTCKIKAELLMSKNKFQSALCPCKII